MKTIKNIILFGDLKGTQNLIENNMREELELRLRFVHEALFVCVEKYGYRTSSLEAFIFSDSFLVRWKDYFEGLRFCVPFSRDLWSIIHHLPYRVFIDSGEVMNDFEPLSQQIARNKKFINITPVSDAFRSVCIAEASHFRESGVYLGKDLWCVTKESLSNDLFIAESFTYKKILFDDSVLCSKSKMVLLD